MTISLTTDARKQALASLKRYFVENLDTEVSELQLVGFLDFLLKEVAPSVYNTGVADAQAYLRDRLADLEGTCYEAEFAYWPKTSSVRRK